MDIKEVALTLKLINTNFPALKIEITRDLVNEWHRHLKEVESELVLQNLDQHIKNSRYFPTISDLIKPLPKLSFYESLKRDTDLFLNSPIVKDSKGEPPPDYVKDYMNKLRSELKNKREKGE